MSQTETLLELVAGRAGHFQLESGYHGSHWLDLEPLFLRSDRLRPHVDELADKLKKYRVSAICGPLVGGAFLAQLIATALDIDFIFTERISSPEPGALYSVKYRLPHSLRNTIRGKTVAIVDDAISAGSSVRATLTELRSHGAQVVAAGALLAMGTKGLEYLASEGVPLERVAQLPYSVWIPAECPQCVAGEYLERIGST